MASTRVNERRFFSCKFSPCHDGLVTCTTSDTPLPLGPGSVKVYKISNNQELELVNSAAWKQALLDVCWSNAQSDVLFTASVDGGINIWKWVKDLLAPIASLPAHNGPISSIQWHKNGSSQQLLSASLDGTHKIWDVERQTPILSKKFDDIALQASFSPLSTLIATTLGKNTVEITDDRCYHKSLSIERTALSCDWSPLKATDLLISTSTGSIHSLDLRFVSNNSPASALQCHRGPARRARWLPAFPNLVVSIGFDGVTAISDIKEGSVLERIRHHSDFVYDVDISPFHPDLLMDCSWDSLLHVFQPRSLQSRRTSIPLCNKL